LRADREQEKIAIKAANVTGTVYSGVDIIEGDRDYVLEINGTPSGKGYLRRAGGCDGGDCGVCVQSV